jgi:ABC-type phosphate/phosphonate transport system substrate-binding protein
MRPSKLTLTSTALGVVTILIAAKTTLASPRDVLVCDPGKPGTTKQAEATMATLARGVEGAGGLPPGSMRFTYIPDAKEAAAFLAKEKPGFAIISPALYLAWKKDRPLTPIAQSEREGKTTIRYLVLVGKSSPVKMLADLAGQTIVTTHADDPGFTARVILGGALEDPVFEQTKSLRRGAMDVTAGKKGALLVDEHEHAMIPKEVRDQFRTVHTSEPVPGAVVVAFADAPAADREAVARGLLGLSGTKEGKEILKAIWSTGFKPPDKATFERLEAGSPP